LLKQDLGFKGSLGYKKKKKRKTSLGNLVITLPQNRKEKESWGLVQSSALA
jgi:hypothetical protein